MPEASAPTAVSGWYDGCSCNERPEQSQRSVDALLEKFSNLNLIKPGREIQCVSQTEIVVFGDIFTVKGRTDIQTDNQQTLLRRCKDASNNLEYLEKKTVINFVCKTMRCIGAY